MNCTEKRTPVVRVTKNYVGILPPVKPGKYLYTQVP